MLEERGGWYVVNVKDARWARNEAFGSICRLEKADEPFPQVGINIFVLEPGKPNCRYHREDPERLYYPASALARRYGAESPEPTPDPQVAYSDVEKREPIKTPPWPA